MEACADGPKRSCMSLTFYIAHKEKYMEVVKMVLTKPRRESKGLDGLGKEHSGHASTSSALIGRRVVKMVLKNTW